MKHTKLVYMCVHCVLIWNSHQCIQANRICDHVPYKRQQVT